MISLFVDTSDKIIIGLLDHNNKWIEYLETNESKGSKILHSTIEKIMIKGNINLSDITNIITVAGPGSYTGLRLAEGFGQVLSLNGLKHYSLYLTDLFRICNIEKASFVTNAFKNEIYYFSKIDEIETNLLISTDRLSSLECDNRYSVNGDYEGKVISKLIKDRSSDIFNYIIQNGLKQKLFYYRTLDEEFKRA